MENLRAWKIGKWVLVGIMVIGVFVGILFWRKLSDNREVQPTVPTSSPGVITTPAEQVGASSTVKPPHRSAFLDSDRDGLYDVDELYLGRNPKKADFDRTGQDQDGDGLTDETEAWFGTDPNKADTDGDGENDGLTFENIILGFKESQDTDQDGLTDYAETKWYGTDPSSPDTDQDGYKDGVEVLGGYNPKGDGRL